VVLNFQANCGIIFYAYFTKSPYPQANCGMTLYPKTNSGNALNPKTESKMELFKGLFFDGNITPD
jgi:hypothetical protein